MDVEELEIGTAEGMRRVVIAGRRLMWRDECGPGPLMMRTAGGSGPACCRDMLAGVAGRFWSLVVMVDQPGMVLLSGLPVRCDGEGNQLVLGGVAVRAKQLFDFVRVRSGSDLTGFQGLPKMPADGNSALRSTVDLQLGGICRGLHDHDCYPVR